MCGCFTPDVRILRYMSDAPWPGPHTPTRPTHDVGPANIHHAWTWIGAGLGVGHGVWEAFAVRSPAFPSCAAPFPVSASFAQPRSSPPPPPRQFQSSRFRQRPVPSALSSLIPPPPPLFPPLPRPRPRRSAVAASWSAPWNGARASPPAASQRPGPLPWLQGPRGWQRRSCRPA